MNRWFRYYDDALNDPKVQRLSGDLFKAWVNLLCLASRSEGKIKCLSEAAFALRLSEAKAGAIMAELARNELMDPVTDGYFEPHNWPARQFKSDVSNERVKRHRKREGNGACNVTKTVTETPPETEADNRTESSLRSLAREQLVKKSRRKATTALPDGWIPSPATQEYAIKQGLSEREFIRETERFRNHARQNDRHCADWDAALRNWCLKAAEDRGRTPSSDSPSSAEESGFYASFSSPEMLAWSNHERLIGKSYPRDKSGGWRFPTQWPPGLDPPPAAFDETRTRVMP